MPKYRQASVEEFLARRKPSTRDGIVYRAASAPKSFNAQDRSQVFVMTDESVDSYGDIVKANGVDLYRFEKNPIALLNHQSMLILGTWSEMQQKPARLEGKVTLASAGTAPHVDMAFNLMSQGILRGASIGFMPTKLEMRLDDDGEPMWSYIISEWELYECSVVSIPANPAALARSAINGDDVGIARDYIEQVLDEWAKTPEGVLIPRSEYEKAYKVIVEKVAGETIAPAGSVKVTLLPAKSELEVKTVPPALVPVEPSYDAAITFVKGLHAGAGIDLVMKDGEWRIESVDTRNIPVAMLLPKEITEADARVFGEKVVGAYLQLDAAPAETEAAKDASDDCDPEDPEDDLEDEGKTAAEAAATPPENKQGTTPIVVTLTADTSQHEAAAEKVDGIFTRLAKKFPMFFPKADAPEQRVEPNIVPVTPPAPPAADEIAAARAKAAAAHERLVSKGLIAA